MFNKRLVSSIALAVLLILSLITTSVAWFANFIEVHTEGEFEASSIVSYFAGGDGTETDPYIVMTPKHLYNLSWLQNQGAFDGKKFYFQVSDLVGNPVTIDMAGMIYGSDSEHKTGAIPPIGTKEKPFEGYLNGCGSVIKNLWVSTRKADWKEQPEGAGDYSSKYVGLFGAIGGEAIIEDFILDTVEVTTHINGAKVGIICGYVNAMVRNVGVYNGIISVVDGAVCTSNYSLLGEKDARIVWDDMPKVDSQYEDTTSGSSGWGGSLDMLEISRRVYYIYGAFGWSQSWSPYANWAEENAKYGLAIYAQTKTPPSKSTQTIYLTAGTMMPLDINVDTVFGDGTEVDGVKTGLPTVPFYRDNKESNKEPVLSGNTGYIVGGASATKGIALRSTYPSVIYKSLGIAKGSSTVFNGDQIQLLTIVPNKSSDSGTTYVIKDDYNANDSANFGTSLSIKTYDALGLKKYTSVRDKLVNSLNGQSHIHALGFNTAVSSSAITTANVKLLDKEISGYEMLKDAINFSVQTPGFVTAVAGSYRQEQDNVYYHTLFDIYKIDREGGVITSVTKIEKIVEANDGQYIYNPTAEEIASYKLVYDAEQMNVLNNICAAYYFEIPLNAGEYAIGFPTGMEKIGNQNPVGAYLLYLDIGSNGGEATTVQRPTKPGEFATIMYDVDYVISTDTDISADSYINHQSLLKINSASSGSKIYYLAAGLLNESTVYYCTGGADITDIAAQTPKKSAPKNRDDTFEGTSFSDRTETK